MKYTPQEVTFTYEFSRACNLQCRFCYNAWKIAGDHEESQLDTRKSLYVLGKVIGETDCSGICLSGGEPLLRDDIFEVISFIKGKNVKVSLVSNGTLLSDGTVKRCLDSGVDSFQVTLLSDRPELHNRLTGGESFEKAIEAVLSIRDRGGRVSTFFVGVAENIANFERTLELNVLLGVPNVAIGRFTPGGAGLEGWEEVMPTPAELQQALRSAGQVSKRYPISVSVSTPVLPCLNDVSEYENLSLGFCAVGGKEQSLFAIDPMGNLKVCSHSPHVLGSLLERSFSDLIKNRFFEDFISTLPEFCRDCSVASICRGGCRSSAHLCYGSLKDEDPYLHRWKEHASKSRAARLGLRKDVKDKALTDNELRGDSEAGVRGLAGEWEPGA